MNLKVFLYDLCITIEALEIYEEYLDTQKHLVQNCADIIKLIHNLFQENCNFATLSVGSGSKFRTSYTVEKILTFIIPPAGIIKLRIVDSYMHDKVVIFRVNGFYSRQYAFLKNF